jgi:iron complex outermembrane recepter protein
MASWLLCMFLSAWPESAATAQSVNGIRQQPLAEALAEFATQTGLQLFYESEIAQGLRSTPVPAGLAATAALTRMLRGTGLTFRFLNERSVQVLARAAAPREVAASPTAQPPDNALEEVVVSAQYRPDTASRVPISMGVWSADDLAAAGARDFATLAEFTPGVDFGAYPDFSSGIETNVAIRGVNANDGSTVAVYLDDTPIPTDRASSFGRVFPLTFALDRVEILRGPQGVTFGEGAQGGAIRFITPSPLSAEPAGSLNGELATTSRGAPSFEAGLRLEGSLREDSIDGYLTASLRREGGFVDRVNPHVGQTVDRHADWTRSTLATAAVRYAPGSSVAITPAVYFQDRKFHDTSAYMVQLSDPRAHRFRNGSGVAQSASDRFALLSVKNEFGMDAAELTSVSAFLRREGEALEDNAELDGLTQAGFASAVGKEVSLRQSTISQQLRLASVDRGGRLSWLAGASYVRSSYHEAQDISTSVRADGGALNGYQHARRVLTQTGAYGQLDWRLWPKLTLGVGLRIERATFRSVQRVEPLSAVVGEQTFNIKGSSTPVVPRYSISYQAAPERLYYATLSRGYRAGGPNDTVGLACPLETPRSYRADSAWGLEVGTKASIPAARVQLEASAFHLTWRNMQTNVALSNCGFGFVVNAGAATSRGADLAVQAAVGRHWKLGIGVEYVDARYEDNVTLNGRIVVAQGDAIGALPLVVSPLSATVALTYEGEWLGGHMVLSIQDAIRGRNPGPFTSDNPGAVTYAPARAADPVTNLLNLRLSCAWSRLELSGYIRNVLDARPQLQVRNQVSTDTVLYATTFRPRTLGLSATWRL